MSYKDSVVFLAEKGDYQNEFEQKYAYLYLVRLFENFVFCL